MVGDNVFNEWLLAFVWFANKTVYQQLYNLIVVKLKVVVSVATAQYYIM